MRTTVRVRDLRVGDVVADLIVVDGEVVDPIQTGGAAFWTISEVTEEWVSIAHHSHYGPEHMDRLVLVTRSEAL